MTLNLNIPTIHTDIAPRITVIGVGGAGGNAVTNMIQSNLEGVEFLIANTDAQAISQSPCGRCIQLGRGVTQGLGSGARPDIGRAATEEALDDILDELDGANMVFITAGMGGGTGTGGAPVIARAAREAGILTVGVVTKPFHFEGVHRMRTAEAGITELTQYVDTLIVIPNQNLFRVANEKTTFADAFKMADDVLHSGVRGVTDLMVMPGLINLDFADIRAVMTEMGKAMMGTGESEGEGRAVAAAEAAISNPLLDDVSMKGARGVLINITGGMDLTLFEVDEAANRIRDEVDPEANIIFGSIFDQAFEGKMRVSVVATGIEADAALQPRPVTLSLVSSQVKSGSLRLGAGGAAGGPTAAAETRAEPLGEPAEPIMEPAELAEPAMAEPAAARDQAFENMMSSVAGAEAAMEAPMAIAEPEPVAQPEPMEQPEAVAQPVAEAAPTVVATAPPSAIEAGERRGVEAQEPTPEDSFVAPPPVEPEAAPEIAVAAQAEPFAAAAMANASRPSMSTGRRGAPGFDRKKAQSLFAKMTVGAARAIQAAAQAGEPVVSQATETRAVASGGGGSTLRPTTQATPEPTVSPAPQPASREPAPPKTQPRLSGLDPKNPAAGKQTEEDLLEIPAFLRRQAN